MRQQQHPWQKNCANWIDVLQRVEAHPTQPRGRIVAAGPSDECMGGLMESDGDDGGQQPDRNGVQHGWGHVGRWLAVLHDGSGLGRNFLLAVLSAKVGVSIPTHDRRGASLYSP